MTGPANSTPRRPRSPWRRYLMFQTPAWVVAAAVLYLLTRWTSLSPAVALALWVAYVVKDLLLYQFVRPAYDAPPPHAQNALVGQSATVVQALAPEGFIRLRGELWKARLENAAPAEAGAIVTVVDYDGLTLICQPAPETRT